MWWETFNERYSNEVDWTRSDIQRNDSRYDPEVDAIKISEECAISITRAECYSLPPEVVEFYRTTKQIIKPHGDTITVCLDDPEIMYDDCGHLNTQINFMDWAALLSERRSKFAYINCNPQSTQYGNIIIYSPNFEDLRILYNSVHELVMDICEWMSITGKLPDFNLDAYLNRTYPYQPFMNATMTHRDVLQSDHPVVQRYKSQISGFVAHNTSYIDYEIRSFRIWAWDKHVKN